MNPGAGSAWYCCCCCCCCDGGDNDDDDNPPPRSLLIKASEDINGLSKSAENTVERNTNRNGRMCMVDLIVFCTQYTLDFVELEIYSGKLRKYI